MRAHDCANKLLQFVVAVEASSTLQWISVRSRFMDWRADITVWSRHASKNVKPTHQSCVIICARLTTPTPLRSIPLDTTPPPLETKNTVRAVKHKVATLLRALPEPNVQLAAAAAAAQAAVATYGGSCGGDDSWVISYLLGDDKVT